MSRDVLPTLVAFVQSGPLDILVLARIEFMKID